MVEYPNQRVSRSEKEDDKFFKPTYDYLIDKAISLNPKTDITNWLKAANGIISNDTINYLVSPLMDTKSKQTLGKLPGEIRDTDLINTIREKNLGEYIGLPYKFTVQVHNADAVLKRDAEVKEKVDKLLQQAVINMLNEHYAKVQEANPEAAGIETGIPNVPVPDIEAFAKNFIEEWIDQRAINGQNILELINAVNDFDTKRIQSFFYWWACEEFYTYREIINNEVYTSVISPLEGYPIFNDEQFVEDYTGFVIKKRTTLTKVKQLYWNKFTKVEREYIENLTKKGGKPYGITGQWLASRTWDLSRRSEFSLNANVTFDVTDNSEALDEYTIIWRTEVPIKIRKFLDPYGNESEEVVSADYIAIPDYDIEVIDEWIEEIYIGKRFGDAITGIYLKPEPCDVQRYDKHTMAPKLPVGGKKGLLRNIIQNPVPKRLISHVIIDRILLLQIERTIGKYQGYITLMPKSLLNDDLAGTKNEKMFYLKADNMLVYDDTSIDFNTVAQGFAVKDMPAVENYLKTLIELRTNNKAEALEMANMNKARLGDIMPSTGKGVLEESIYRAALGNVLSITMFNATLEKDHIADLEFSKIAYHDEKRGSYTDRSSGKHIYVDINLEEHRETDYGCIVENSKVDQEKIDLFRKIAFNASQNGDTDSAVAAVELDTVPELRQALKKISKANKDFEKALEDERNKTAKYVADLNAKVQEDRNATVITVAEINGETARDVAEMKIDSEFTPTETPDINNDGEESKTALRRDELEFKRNDSNAKNALKERQLRAKERNDNEKLKLAKNKPIKK